ncbi:hypothetical protein ACFL3V_03855 [Nanoarchaeota archaeon]
MIGHIGGLEILLKRGVGDRSKDILAGMLNDEWGSQVKADREMIRKRFDSGATFFVAYDHPSEEDASYIRNKHGIYVSDKKIPIGLVETVAIFTEGNRDHVPQNYQEITNKGYWRSPTPGADTIILVDITLLRTRRGKTGNGEASALLKYAVNNAKKKCPFVWTFTPEDERLRIWHMIHGAMDTNHILWNARPGYRNPNVVIMDYSWRPQDSQFLLPM